MFLQRISIEGGGVGMVAFGRIPVFGYTIERLLFSNGLNKVKIFQGYNFINVCFYDINYNIDTFYFDDYLKILFVREKIDVSNFLELTGYQQLKFIAKYVYIALKKVFERDDLPINILDKAYTELLKDDFYMMWSSDWVKGQHINVKTRNEYDKETVKLEIEKKKQIIYSNILFTIDPIKRVNHISEMGGKRRSLIETIGYIEPNIFRIKIAHKEYNFILDTFQIEVVEHNELKNEFFDWECIHDGVMFQS